MTNSIRSASPRASVTPTPEAAGIPASVTPPAASTTPPPDSPPTLIGKRRRSSPRAAWRNLSAKAATIKRFVGLEAEYEIIDHLDPATRALCNRLRDDTVEIKRRQLEEQAWSSVEPNKTYARCLQANQVSIDVPGPLGRIKKFLHANVVTFRGKKPDAPSRNAIAAQSPNDRENLDRILTRAIESGQGIFEFVSPEQQKSFDDSIKHLVSRKEYAKLAHTSHAQPILRHCTERYKDKDVDGKTKPVIVGGRFKLLSALPISQFYIQDHDHYQKDISFIDLTEPKESQMLYRFPVMQVGLPFKNSVLEAAEIKRASALVDVHNATVKAFKEDTSLHGCRVYGYDAETTLQAKTDETTRAQLFLSPAGFGRNATLMTYQDLKQRIQDGEIGNVAEIDDALHAAIIAGRETRGYRFVHSNAQVAALRSALLDLLPKPKPVPKPAFRWPTDPPVEPVLVEPAPVAPIPTVRPVTPAESHARAEVGDQLMTALQRAVVEKVNEFSVLDAIADRTDEQNQQHRQLRFDIGERQRLQHVLREFLDNGIPSLPVHSEQVPALSTAALADHYARLRAASGALHGEQTAEDLRFDAIDPNQDLVAQPALRSRTCIDENSWIRAHDLGEVRNSGLPGRQLREAGGNCLIVALLQHATGNYVDRFHTDMAKILREGLVAQFGRGLLPTPDSTESLYESMLHRDSAAGKALIPMINTLFCRRLEPHWLTLSWVKQRVVEHLTHDADEPLADSSAEPVLIYQSQHYYEAVVPKNAHPGRDITTLASLEERMRYAYSRFDAGRAPLSTVSAAMETHKARVMSLIAEQNQLLDADKTFAPMCSASDVGEDNFRHLIDIGNRHSRPHRDSEVRRLRGQFNLIVDAVLAVTAETKKGRASDLKAIEELKFEMTV